MIKFSIQRKAPALYKTAWQEIYDLGYGPNIVDFSEEACGNLHFMVAKDGRRYAGLFSFEVLDDRNPLSLYIELAYVRPSYRGLGLFKLLHTNICEHAKKLGAVSVEYTVHRDNTVMQSAQRGLDGVNLYQTFIHEVN